MAIKFSLSTAEMFLVPDIKYLVKFANGELGIQEQMFKEIIVRSTATIKDSETLDHFKKTMGFSLTKESDYYIVDGKCKVKASDITLDTAFDSMGLKALEKSLIQSIFESQKPYAEIFIETVGCLVKIEDIIARVLSLGGSSLKPKFNPKALGYQPSGGKSDLNKGLSKVKSLKNKPRIPKGVTQSYSNLNRDPITSTSATPDSGVEYQIVSTVYSTGEYDPTVQYNYEYIDIYDDTINESDLSDDEVSAEEETIEDKPKVVVFGLYDDKGNPVDNVPKWLIDSGKWFGQFDMISDFKYVWTHPLFGEKKSFGSPGNGWKQKKDKDDNPIVIYNTNSDTEFFKNYFNDITKTNLEKSSLTQEEKNNVINEINSRIDYKLQTDALITSGFLPTLELKNGNIPIKKIPFKPKKVNYKSKDIWIDPEEEYDLKVIKVVPTFKIKFYDTNNNLVDAKIDPLSILRNLQKNQVEVILPNKKRKVINIGQIKNDQLSKDTPYSKGYYGSSTSDHKQEIDEVLRYITSFLDNNVYYIVEGILESENDQAFPVVDNGKENSGGKGSKYYIKPKGPISAIRAFIKLIVDIFAKLIPSINTLLTILKNPASFIVDIILQKAGDNNGLENVKFDIFSKKFRDDFTKLATIPKDNREDFVKKSKIKNYVYVDENKDYRFLLDGTSLVKFLSFTFGIGLNKLIPKLTFKLDRSKNKKALNTFLNLSNTDKEMQVNTSQLSNTNLKQKLDTSTNQIITTANGITTIEEVSIQYSTGQFKEGVDYEYIYVTEYVNQLEIEADRLSETDDPESQSLALAKYEEAYIADPDNKNIKEKINNLKNKTGFNTQPIFDFLLNFVTFPFNVIKNIIDYILNFFKSLSNPFELPKKIGEFISFKWILDFLKPNKLLEIIGIKFDIGLFYSWVKNIDSFPDDHMFDLSQVISMPFIPKLFEVDKEGLKTALLKTPLSMLSSIVCLIEAIINAFIDFLWGLMGLKPLIPTPHIKLCKDTNKDVNPKDFMDLMNGNYVDALSSEDIGKEVSYDFVYDITLPDGIILRDLDYQGLQSWIDDNKDTQFEIEF